MVASSVQNTFIRAIKEDVSLHLNLQDSTRNLNFSVIEFSNKFWMRFLKASKNRIAENSHRPKSVATVHKGEAE